MTYSLAVKCANGVMLAADTKFTVNGGSDYVYGHKITGEIGGVLTAFAGSREPFEEFRMRLREYTAEPVEKRNRLDQLLIRIKEIMRTSDNHYSSFKFDVLVEVSTSLGTELRYFYQDGSPEIVDKYKAIGSGAPYGMVYLKTHWWKDIFMDEAADLTYFIIRYIEKFKLDLTVGTGEEFPHPLIRFVTPGYLEEISKVEPTENDYKRYENNAQIRLNKIEKSLVSDYELAKTT
jgi:20S proteasome alpha/beta subunit